MSTNPIENAFFLADDLADNAAITETFDAPDATSTPYTMGVGDTFSGTIGSSGDNDWIAITLTAGVAVQIGLDGVGATPVGDTYLRLRDSSGNIIAENDDIDFPANVNSSLQFIASTSGIYYIDAGAFEGAGDFTGGYQVEVTTVTSSPVFSFDQIAEQLTDGYWEDFRGVQRRAFDIDAGGTLNVNISALTAEGQQLAMWAFEAWTFASGIHFNVVTSGTTHITFDDSGSSAGATSTVSGNTILSSFVNVGTGWLDTYGTTADTYSLQTYIHEIGHALGLGHAGNYNSSATYGVDNHYLNDSWQATIMSYFNQNENTFVDATHAYILTPMIADIIAIQNLYGTTTLRGGNDVYSYADYFDFDNPIAMTVIDTGGIDTLDLSIATGVQDIDLRPEGYSDVDGGIGNLGIARGTIIENLIGGSGNDSVTGNAAWNTLDGASGNDTIRLDGLNGADGDIFDYGGTIYALDRGNGSFDTLVNFESYTDGFQTITTAQIDMFDGLAYAASYDDLALAFRTNVSAATWHYLTTGFDEGRETSFNPAQYLANYADLQSVFGGNLAGAMQHFVTSGVDEHRLAEDPLDYIASFADLIDVFHGLSLGQTIAAGLTHYQGGGWSEGRRGGIEFNPFQYMANYADLQGAFGTNDNLAAWHFINSGYGEGRMWEDPLEYVASYADLIGAFGGRNAAEIAVAGLTHFQGSGYAEGRRAGIDFDVDQYLANYADLRDAFVDGVGGYNEAAATLHFIQAGFGEGRTDDVLVV